MDKKVSLLRILTFGANYCIAPVLHLFLFRQHFLVEKWFNNVDFSTTYTSMNTRNSTEKIWSNLLIRNELKLSLHRTIFLFCLVFVLSHAKRARPLLSLIVRMITHLAHFKADMALFFAKIIKMVSS